MAVPASTTEFAVGAATVSLPIPDPGYTPEYERSQVIGKTAAGEVRVYDKEIDTYRLTFSLTLTDAQKDNLLAFIRDTLKGAKNTFTYTDHLSVAHANCRLLDANPRFTKTPGARYRVTLEIATEELAD